MKGKRPRVAHVLHSMVIAGAETLVSQMIDHLSDEFEFSALLLDEVGPLGEEAERRGVPVRVLNRVPGLDRGLMGRLGRSLRELRVDLVHAHQYTPWFYATIGAALGWSRPRILFTEHGRHYPDVPRPKRMIFNQALLPFTDGLVAVSGFVRDCLLANEGLPASRVQVIYNGIAPEKFCPAPNREEVRAAQGLGPGDLVVGIAARFAPVKDHATLIRAFHLVHRKFPEARLVFAGDGPLRPASEDLVRELGIHSACRFLGVRRDVPCLLGSWDVFALSSLSEGTSVTLLEAMATGLPAVATGVGGNPEIVVDGETGLLSPRGDADALARSLERLFEDRAKARRMGEAGRARVEREFTLERMMANYRILYRSLLSGERT